MRRVRYSPKRKCAPRRDLPLWYFAQSILGGRTVTDKELRKLKRVELLEMLVEQSKEVERLKVELESTRAQLEERRILIEKAGSIAEAALQLNGVFAAAQAAADQYLSNIQQLQASKSAEEIS